MRAVFKELPGFSSRRREYLSDEDYAEFQVALMCNPKAGDVIRGAGGLRKVRVSAPSRGKGKRGGSRVIYYWHLEGSQFLLFTIYGKDELADLTPEHRRRFRLALEAELAVLNMGK